MNTSVLRSRATSESWLNTAMAKVYGLMFLGLLISTLVAGFVAANPPVFAAIFGNVVLKWIVILAPIGLALVMGIGAMDMPAMTLRILFFVFAAVFGLSLSVVFLAYTTASIVAALVSTVGLFGIMSVYGYFTKRDLTSIGDFLMMALLGIILAGIVNIFLHSSAFATLISVVAVFVFLAFTAYDTQKIRDLMWSARHEEHRIATLGAMTLFLDFANLFLHLLQLMGDRK